MTNYDVIEAYVEDFTNWNYVKARGVATISQHKFIITECILKGLNIVEDIQEPYSNLTVRIIGITDNQEVLITDYVNGKHQIINTITEDGIYTIEDRHHFVGFGCNFVGTCNITIEQLPTSILKDFSGNNHDAYLYGFKGKLDSGIGIYKIDFSKTLNASAFDNFERLNNKVIAKGNYSGNWNVFGEYDINGIVKNKVAIKITGLNNIKEKLSLEYGYFTTDSKYIKNIILIDKDGIYTYDLNDIIIPDGSNIAYTIYNRMYFGEQIINDINLIVEEIPDYSNQLCYDGRSCGVAYDMPILTDYTIIADRTWFNIRDISCFIGKRNASGDNLGAFEFEFRANRTFSFGGNNVIIFADNNIVYQTKNSYNGTEIKSGSLDDTDILIIGAAQRNVNNRAQDPYIGCHGNILIFNRTLTEYELSWVKNNMMCSKQ